MPKYIINGKTVHTDVHLSDEEIDYIAAQIGAEKQGDDKGGFLSSAINTAGQGIAGLGTIATETGSPIIGERLSKYGHRIMEENPTVIHSFEDIANDPMKWVTESSGAMGAQALGTIGGGLLGRGVGAGIGALTGPFAPVAVPALSTLGGFIGGIAPMTAQEYGAQREEQARQGVDDPLRASIGALGNVALEHLGGFRPAGVLKDLSKGAKDLAGLSTGQAAKYLAVKGIKSGASEAIEEVPQQYVGAFGGGTDIEDLNTPENLQQAALGAAMAFPGGAGFGAGHALAGHYFKKPEEEPATQAAQEEPATQATQEEPATEEEPFIRRAPPTGGGAEETFADSLGVRKPNKPAKSSVYDKLNALDPNNPNHIIEASKLLKKVATTPDEVHTEARNAIHEAADIALKERGPSYTEFLGLKPNNPVSRELNNLYINNDEHSARASELLSKLNHIDADALQSLEEHKAERQQDANQPNTISDEDTVGLNVPTGEANTTGIETPERGGLDTSANTTEQPTTGEVGSDDTLKTPELKEDLPYKLHPVPLDNGKNAEVVDYNGRKMVMADVNGAKVPFYLSTGQGGKENVKAGKWYPFLGIGNDGWINKGDESLINSFYKHPALKNVAKQLNEKIGDIRNSKSEPKVTDTGASAEAFNEGFSPITRDGNIDQLIKNIYDLHDRIGQPKKAETPEAVPDRAAQTKEFRKKLAEQGAAKRQASTEPSEEWRPTHELSTGEQVIKVGDNAYIDKDNNEYIDDYAEPIASSKAAQPATGHTADSLRSKITNVLDKTFGKGWTQRLENTGKFKLISSKEAADITGDDSLRSVADIKKLAKDVTGLDHFADQFQTLIKQPDKTVEDVNRIAQSVIGNIKANPEYVLPKVTGSTFPYKRYLQMPDGNTYDPNNINHVDASPETKLIYDAEQKGEETLHKVLQIEADGINKQRAEDLGKLASYLDGNGDYTKAEQAMILDGARKFGYSTKQKESGVEVSLVNLSDSNTTPVAVIDGLGASLIAEQLRKGVNIKQAMKIGLQNFVDKKAASRDASLNGWRVFKQSDTEEDAVELNKACAGREWCTAGAVSTARSHRSGGDFWLYFDKGEAKIALRTTNGKLAEPPRGSLPAQRLTSEEAKIANDFLKSGKVQGGEDFVSDQEYMKGVINGDIDPLTLFTRGKNPRRLSANGYGRDSSIFPPVFINKVQDLYDNTDFKPLGFYENLPAEHEWDKVIVLKHMMFYYGDTETITLPNAVYVGSIWASNRNIYLPVATSVGSISNTSGVVNLPKVKTAESITSNTGSIIAPSLTRLTNKSSGISRNSGVLDIPNLVECSYIDNNDMEIRLPKLKAVKNIKYNKKGVIIPNVQTVNDIEYNSGTVEADKLTEVVWLQYNTGNISLPKLQKVEYLSANSGDMYLPELTTVNTISKHLTDVHLPNVTEVNQIRDNTGNISLPKLQKVNIISSNTGEVQAPAEVLNKAFKYSKNKTTAGFFDPKSGTTYIVADNISANASDEYVLGLVMHEVAVHALKMGKSSAEFKALLKQFAQLKKSNPLIAAAYARVPQDTNPKAVDEEALAYFIEENPKAPFTQRLLQMFRKFIRAIGNNLKGLENTKFMQWANQLSEQDLREMAIKALRGAPETLGEKTSSKKDILKSFAGVKANTADLSSRDKAVQRLALGDSPSSILEDTGWFKGADGLWRFELDSSKAKLTNAPTESTTLADVIDYPELFKAYPQLKTYRAKPTPVGDPYSGGYNPSTKAIEFKPNNLSTLLHEIQHAIQSIEGFPNGSNEYIAERELKAETKNDLETIEKWLKENEPTLRALNKEWHKPGSQAYKDWIASKGALKAEVDAYRKKLNDIQALINPYEIHKKYRRSPGELEASNVQYRQNMTPTMRKANPPSRTEQAILKKIDAFGSFKYSKIPEVDAFTGKPSQHTKTKTKPSLAKLMMDAKRSLNWTKLEQLLFGFEAPVSKAVKDLDTFSRAGELNAGFILRGHTQQLVNLIKTSFEKGPVMLSGEGLGMIDPKADPSKALFNIHEQVRKIGEKNGFDGSQVFGEIMRVKWGEETQMEDAAMRQRGAQHRVMASQLKQQLTQLIKQGGATPTAINDLMNEIKLHQAKANKFEHINRDKDMVSQSDIAKANDVLKAIPEFNDLIKGVRDNTRANVNLWHSSGLIDKTTRDTWNSKQYYMPMQIFEEHPEFLDESHTSFLGKSGARSIAEMKSRKGHEQAVNFWDNLVKQQAFMIGVALKNETRNAALTQLERVGVAFRPKNQTSAGKKGDYVVSYLEGQKTWWKVASPEIVDSFQTFNHELPRILNMGAEVTNTLRTVTLVQPNYWFKQLIIDPIHASFVSDVGLVTPLHSFKELVSIMANKSKTAETLRKHGVLGPVALPTYHDLHSQLGYALKRKPVGIRKIGHLIYKLHEATDSATRVAIYKKALDKAKRKGLTGQKAENFAAHKARETMNFAVHGTSSSLNTARHLIPFFSSSLNGLATTWRAARGTHLNAKEKAEIQGNFWRSAGVMFIMSALYAIMLGDDKDYKDLKDFDKDNNWLIPLPDKDGKHEFIRIPIPYEIGFMFKTIPELLVRRTMEDINTAQLFKGLRDGLAKNAPPMGLAQAGKPIVETMANHDFFTGRSIESESDLHRPVEMRGISTASELANVMSKNLGLHNIGLSPAKIDHLIKGYLTEWGTIGTAIASHMLLALEGKQHTPIKDLIHQKGSPFHAIITDSTNTRSMSRLYAVAEDAKELVNAVNYYKKHGQIKALQEIRADKDKLKLIRAQSVLKGFTDQEAAIRNVILNASNRPDTPANRAFIKQRQMAADKIAERAVEYIKRMGLE